MLIHKVHYVNCPRISTYSLKGSFGEPAAGSTSPSAGTRPREFVFVFAVRSSCLCGFVRLFVSLCLSVKSEVFSLKLGGFRGVREERTDHTKLFLRSFTETGLLNIRKVDFQDCWNYWKATSSQNGLKTSFVSPSSETRYSLKLESRFPN